jgi:DNA-binding NarL/FixJ family response regulator
MECAEDNRGAARQVEKTGPVGVLVVDDQAWFREVVRDVVEATDGFRLVGEADSGEAAIDAADRLAPGLVIMDKRMPGMGGIEACRTITERHPEAVVMICSVEDPDAELASDCAAAVFVAKWQLSTRLLREIWRTRGV